MSICIKCQSVMILHFPGNSMIIAWAPVHSISGHDVRYRIASAHYKDSWICYACYFSTLKVWISLFYFPDHPRLLCGIHFQSYICLSLFATIQLTDPIHTSAIIDSIPANSERFSISKVVASSDQPSFRYLKRLNNMGPFSAFII